MNWLDELFTEGVAVGSGTQPLEPETYSSQVIKCDRPMLAIYNGPQTVSMTADKSQALDGVRWRLLYLAGSWTTMAFSIDLDPAQTEQYLFDSTADDYLVEWEFSAAGQCFTMNAEKVKIQT